MENKTAELKGSLKLLGFAVLTMPFKIALSSFALWIAYDRIFREIFMTPQISWVQAVMLIIFLSVLKTAKIDNKDFDPTERLKEEKTQFAQFVILKLVTIGCILIVC